MKQNPLPAEFVAFLKGYVASAQFTSPRRMFRGLIFRWCLWADGHQGNALPGYTACPQADELTGFPAGWSERKFRDIAREAIGTDVVRTARRRASLLAAR